MQPSLIALPCIEGGGGRIFQGSCYKVLKTKIDAAMVTCKSIPLPEEHSNTQSLKYYNLALGKVFTNHIVLIYILCVHRNFRVMFSLPYVSHIIKCSF